METEEKLIDEKLKFNLKTYLKFLIIEPWVSKFQMPNFRTINFVLLFLAAFFKWRIILFITIFLAIIFHMIGEYKSGEHINWYRNYHYKKLRKNRKETNTQLSADKSSREACPKISEEETHGEETKEE